MSVGASVDPARPAAGSGEGGPDATFFVALVWLAASIATFFYVAYFASPVPFADDLSLAALLAGQHEWNWSELMLLHNEHVIAVTKLVVVPLTLLFNDIRAAMYLQVALFSALSLAALLVARRLRGASAYSDAFFPLLWLGWGNTFNLMMAFQVAITLPAVVVGAFLVVAASRRGAPSLGVACLLGLGLAAAPLCSAAGVLLVPPLALWLGLCALESWRAGARGAARGRATAIACSLGALAGLASVLLFLQVYVPAEIQPPRPTPWQALQAVNRFHGLALSASGSRIDPVSGWMVNLASLLALVGCGLVLLRRPAERLRAAGVLAALLATLGISASIAWGRGSEPLGGIALRYISLPAPLLGCAYMASVLWAPAAAGRLARYALFAMLAFCVGDNAAVGSFFGHVRRTETGRILADLRMGWDLWRVAEAHPELMMELEPRVASLEALRRAGLPPFEEGGAAEAGSSTLSAATRLAAREGLGLEPSEVVAPGGVLEKSVFGLHGLALNGDARISFAKEPGKSKLGAMYGMMPATYLWGKTDGLLFEVELVPEEGEPQLLFARLLQPTTEKDDRGPHTLELELPAGVRGTLLLRTSNPPGHDGSADWAFWSGIVLR